jgi:BMFP domain-containing protein YqiC
MVAIGVFVQARRRHAALEARRQELERDLGA